MFRIKPAMLVCLVLSLLISAELTAQQNHQERVKVVNRITDFRVYDQSGKPVSGLKASDFKLRVDGKPVEIIGLDEFKGVSTESEVVKRFEADLKKYQSEGGEPPTPPTKPRYFYFLINIHDSGNRANIEHINTALEIVEKTLLPHDRGAVLVYNGTLRVFQPLTSNKASIKKAINRAKIVRMSDYYYPSIQEIAADEQKVSWGGGGIARQKRPGSDPSGRPSAAGGSGMLGSKQLEMIMSEKEMKLRNYISALEAFAKSTRNIGSRKNLIMFSEGNNIYDPETPNHELQIAVSSWQKFDREMNASNITVYNIKRGQQISEWEAMIYDPFTFKLDPAPISGIKNITTMRNIRLDSLRTQAQVTGGKFFDVAVPVKEIVETLARESGYYYTISFIPPKGKPGRLQKLEIECLVPDYTVKHRHSIYMEKRFNELDSKEKELHLAEVLGAESLKNQLGVSLAAFEIPSQKEKHLMLSFSIDENNITTDRSGNKEVEFLLISESMDSKEVYSKHSLFRAKEGGEGRLFFNLAVPLLKSKKTKVNLVLRDNATGLRTNWRGIYRNDENSKNVKLSSPAVYNSSSRPCSWQENSIFERGKTDLCSVVEGMFTKEILSQEGCLQGHNAQLMFFIGNIEDKVNVAQIHPKAGFYLDPRSDQGFALAASAAQVKYHQQLGCILVKGEIPLGYAQKAKGQLFVAVQDLAPGGAILSSCEYRISDFNSSRAEQLKTTGKIVEMKN